MISFRPLAPEDADAVACIERESFPTPWSREDFWREASNDFACYIVALEGTAVIGFAGCWISFEEAQVTNIALTAMQRGRGFGHLLMCALMRAAAERGVERMTLEVRPSNPAAFMSGWDSWRSVSARATIRTTTKMLFSCGIRN